MAFLPGKKNLWIMSKGDSMLDLDFDSMYNLVGNTDSCIGWTLLKLSLNEMVIQNLIYSGHVLLLVFFPHKYDCE